MFSLPTNSRTKWAAGALVVAAILAFGAWRLFGGPSADINATAANASTEAGKPSDQPAPVRDSVDLSDSQLASVKVEPVAEHDFPVEKEAVGSIDFNEDMETQVFTPYQGRIIALYAAIGDDVKKGQTLFTIDSPDLLQAESTLIAAAGVLELTTRNLARLRELYKTLAVSQNDLEQAISDQQTAEGNLRAGRDAVRIFGKTDAEIDRIVANRAADPTLIVPSPIDGRITARNAGPGLLVQPGDAPAPYTVADINVCGCWRTCPRADSPAFRVGQEVHVDAERVSRAHVRRQGHDDRRERRSRTPAASSCAPRSTIRSMSCARACSRNFVIQIGPPVRAPAHRRSTAWCARATAP